MQLYPPVFISEFAKLTPGKACYAHRIDSDRLTLMVAGTLNGTESRIGICLDRQRKPEPPFTDLNYYEPKQFNQSVLAIGMYLSLELDLASGRRAPGDGVSDLVPGSIYVTGTKQWLILDQQTEDHEQYALDLTTWRVSFDQPIFGAVVFDQWALTASLESRELTLYERRKSQ